MPEKPSISVLIPVHNGEKSIGAAIWSILNQDHQDLELLVYLDGCTDNTKGVVEGIQHKRLHFFEAEENRGIVYARNYLLGKVRGKYIAWLDADDLALPGRLQKQFKYLEKHAEINFLGTWCEVRNSSELRGVKWPSDPALLQVWLLFRNPLMQSSVMFRRSVYTHPLLFEYEYLEDYEFYCRQIDKRCFQVLPEMLCSYHNPGSTELLSKHRDYSFHKKSTSLLDNNLESIGLKLTRPELEIFHGFLRSQDNPKKAGAVVIFRILLLIKKVNQDKGIFEQQALNKVIMYQLLRLLKLSPAFRPTVLRQLLSSPVALVQALKAGPRYT